MEQLRAARRDGLDTLRGVTLISMMVSHACWDLVYLFGHDWAWYRSFGAYVWQQSICWTFILLSGYCFSLGRRHLRRGLMTLGGGAAVSLASQLSGAPIYWGVLTFLGTATLLTIPLDRLLRRVPARAGLAGSFCLFWLARDVNDGYLGFEGSRLLTLPPELYQNTLTAFLGFLSRLPPLEDHRELRLPLVTALGRRSLLVYLLHQPLIFGGLWLLSSFGN